MNDCTILYWYVIYRFLQCCNMFALEVGPCFSCCSIPLNFGDVVTVRGMQTVWSLNTPCVPCTDSEWLPSYDKIDSIEIRNHAQEPTLYWLWSLQLHVSYCNGSRTCVHPKRVIFFSPCSHNYYLVCLIGILHSNLSSTVGLVFSYFLTIFLFLSLFLISHRSSTNHDAICFYT